MNKTILNNTIAVLAATIAATSYAGQPVVKQQTKSVVVREEFGTFLGVRPYSQTLGLSLWESGGAKLYEAHEDMDIKALSGAKSKLGKKVEGKLKEIAKGSGGTLLTDYSKMGVGTYLGFEGNQGSAVLMRLRNQFQFINENTTDATYNYVDDRKADDSGGQIQAALMLDFYLDPLYNKQWFNPLGLIEKPYRFWIRTGMEINKNDLPGATEVDQQKFFALLNFQANPDQNFSIIPGPKRLEINSPQIVQLGAVFERNELSGEESTHWIVGWAPLLNILDEVENGWFQGFGLNKRMYFGKTANAPQENTAKIVSTNATKTEVTVDSDKVNHEGRFYSSIDPSFALLGQSDARGVLKAAGKKLAGVRSAKDLEKLREEQFHWQVKALLGYDDGMVELSYTATGTHSLSDLGDSSISQEARLDVDVAKAMIKFSGMQDVRAKDWQNFKAYVSYKRGEFEPTYADVDLLSAGVSVRF